MKAPKVNLTSESKKSAGRRPGRPPGGALNHQQRSHLLDVALHLFAQHGIAETSLNAIARSADVSPAMLNYYFHSREALLDIIIEERFIPLRSRIFDVFVAHADEPVTAITGLIREIAETAQHNSWFAPLWMQETLSEYSPLRQRIDERFGNDNRQRILEIIEGWKRDGRINPQLNPHLLVVSLLSLVLVPLTKFRDSEAFATSEMIVQHALALLCRGIAGAE